MRETLIQAKVRAVFNTIGTGVRLYRNNVGMDRSTNVRYGLATGSADLVGVRRVEVTEDMVGTVIGQFVAIEVKTPKGRLRDEQKIWLRTISELGGIAEVVRSEEEAEQLLTKWMTHVKR